jgi:hypothetical protein
MLSPKRHVEAYDCSCDMANEFDSAEERESHATRRSHCFVLVED